MRINNYKDDNLVTTKTFSILKNSENFFNLLFHKVVFTNYKNLY